MRTRDLAPIVLGLLAFPGCASEASEPAGEDESAIGSGASLTLEMSIAESKVVFDSRLEGFRIKSGADAVPCREQDVSLTSKPSLYAAGWSPEKAADFAEGVSGARYRNYPFASCRDAGTEVLAWFGKERDIELSIGDTLVSEDYSASRLPLLLRHVSLASGEATYYACNGNFAKTLTGETENAKRYDIAVTCRRRAAPSKAQLGPIDFVTNPGPYAALASYRPWLLPAVPATAEKFESVRAALLAKVPAGKYTGAMSTLAKGCNLTVEKTEGGLVLEHVIQSSRRKRRIELKAEALLGFVEGDLFADPIRAEGAPVGRFAAAEFSDGKGDSIVVRFEKNDGLDGKIVRVDGVTSYCRRLTAQ